MGTSGASSFQTSSIWRCRHDLPAVVKITKRGENIGRKYYSCSQFPPCRFFEWYDGEQLNEGGVGDHVMLMMKDKEKQIEKLIATNKYLETKVEKLKLKNRKVIGDNSELRMTGERVERLLGLAVVAACVFFTLFMYKP